jgi:hypothetical protein
MVFFFVVLEKHKEIRNSIELFYLIVVVNEGLVVSAFGAKLASP